jgi:alpha-1,2-mannosyltransferase
VTLVTGPAPRLTPRQALLALGLFAASAALNLLRFGSVQGVIAALDHCAQPFCDFQQIFLPMGRAVLETGKPVDGFFYPPFAALLFWPFAKLGETGGMIAWGAVQFTSVAALVVIPHRWLRAPGWLWPAYVAVVATSLPVLHGLKWGQVSLPLTALALAGLAATERGRPLGAAAAFAVAISVKLYPGVAIVPALVKRDFRLLTALLALLLTTSVFLPAVALGPGNALAFTAEVAAAAATALEQWVWRDPNSQFFGHVLGRWLGNVEVAQSLWLQLLGGAVAIANLWLLLRRKQGEARWAWTLGFGSLPFLLRTSWPHYFAFLPLSQALLAAELLHLPKGRAVVGALLGGSALVASALPLWVTGDWYGVSYAGAFFLGNLLTLAAAWVLALSEKPGS